MKQIWIFLFLTVACMSCRYRTVGLKIDGDSVVRTSIPVIKKDSDGYLRNYLAQEMSFTNSLYYTDQNPKYNLMVSITEDYNTKITFSWDRDPKTGDDLKVFYPSEGMREIVAKIELVDIKSGDSVIKPFFLSASADYDFVNPTVREAVEFPLNNQKTSVLQYSLGQLDSEEGAKSASYKPAYEKLAKKIINRLNRTRINM